MLDDELQSALDRRAAKGTLRNLTVYPTTPSSSSSSTSSPQQPALVDFSSNDYLSLATSSRVRSDFVSIVTRNPALSSQLGSAGSRLLDGNSSIHEQIEYQLTSHFASSSAGLLFNSGYEANVSLLSTLPQPKDVVIYDELVHASVHDGLRRSRVPARLRIPFRHNSTEHLEQILESLTRDGTLTAGSSNGAGERNVWLAVESVYSMDGDACPLNALLDVMSRYVDDRRICGVVDEAHSTALYGERGRGLVNALGLQRDPRIAARLMTFGKAWGASGAIVLCSQVARHYLINYARPLIFSTALGYPQLASIMASFNSIQDGTAQRAARKTFANSRRLVDGFEAVIRTQRVGDKRSVALPPHLKPASPSPDSAKHGLEAGKDDFVGWSMQQPSPIIPLLTADARELAAHLRANGLLARPICYPTVPKGEDRVRICVHADNAAEDIDRLIECVRQWVGGTSSPQPVVRSSANDGRPTTRTAQLLASKL
ncbi:class II aminotransferase/8-amino-7-oxononanoate synthase [Pseudozyma hubeiensis SY62]|uniref:Class II aminotransferase/8-amino-7-oxononanoate synthase n=1 Tax=Pseudozyma hubeiensis (strain SY62) TaxID=1305764 RepID=R9P6T8_PSEHS|nr:class II aminotransferase/8-amino-7-oxononanoate synthase [Pseudozyma hubeiensis SY62]GAC97054.1 class II aminotransferase/8-amino-7-oxononanoate synthase [Pseudozyma hubeiensis SY62]